MPWEVYEPLQCQKFFGSTEIIGDEDVGQHRHKHGPGGHAEGQGQQGEQAPPPPAPAPAPAPQAQPAPPPPPPPQPKRRKAICATCQGPISSSNPGCKALDQVFHINCFKCKTCGKTLAGSQFFNIENNPTCSECYQKTLENCHKCHQKITDRILRARGGVFHVNCFTCESCQKSLDGVPFTSDQANNVYCLTCFNEKFAPRCAVCNKPIVPGEGEKEATRVIAMDKSFHPACYKCEDCGMQLSSKVEGAGCYPLNDHLYCKNCNLKRLRGQK